MEEFCKKSPSGKHEWIPHSSKKLSSVVCKYKIFCRHCNWYKKITISFENFAKILELQKVNFDFFVNLTTNKKNKGVQNEKLKN